MSVTTMEKFCLDFQTNNIININAKQFDTKSRFINIVCSDHGKVVTLNSVTESVFVRWKKADETCVFKMGEILEDGSVLVELNQQMLMVSGTQVADIFITSKLASDAETAEDLESLFANENTSIISTMKFNVNVVSAPFEAGELVSDDDVTALTDALLQFQDKYTNVINSINLCEESAAEAKEQAGAARNAAREAKLAADDASNELINMQELMGSIDDDETKDTLYGVKKACEKAIELAKEAANKAEEIANTTSALVGSKDDTSDKNTVYGAMKASEEVTKAAQEIVDSCEETINNCVKKAGDEMSGDLITPNLNAKNSIMVGQSKFEYDADSASVVISFPTSESSEITE